MSARHDQLTCEALWSQIKVDDAFCLNKTHQTNHINLRAKIVFISASWWTGAQASVTRTQMLTLGPSLGELSVVNGPIGLHMSCQRWKNFNKLYSNSKRLEHLHPSPYVFIRCSWDFAQPFVVFFLCFYDAPVTRCKMDPLTHPK